MTSYKADSTMTPQASGEINMLQLSTPWIIDLSLCGKDAVCMCMYTPALSIQKTTLIIIPPGFIFVAFEQKPGSRLGDYRSLPVNAYWPFRHKRWRSTKIRTPALYSIGTPSSHLQVRRKEQRHDIRHHSSDVVYVRLIYELRVTIATAQLYVLPPLRITYK